MNPGNYVLCVEKSNVTSVNNLHDVVFKPDKSIWAVTFQADIIKLKTNWVSGETCILTGKAVNPNQYQSFAQNFNKQIHAVYEIDRINAGCPYGGTLVIFTDMTTVWTTNGSGFRYIGVDVGYFTQTNMQLAKEIGWF